MRVSVLLALALAVSGCLWDLTVNPTSPRPNVVIAADKSPAVLVLAPTIASDFVIPGNGSVNDVTVHGWRQTLEAGFHAAFPTGPSGRKLELMEAQLAFGPAAAGWGGTAAVVASIRYKARVLDAQGNELSVFAGTATARAANTAANAQGMTANAGMAVEALYEGLTAELLAKV
jgi:hypothetical protein